MESAEPVRAIAHPQSRKLTIVLYTIVVFLYWIAQYLYQPTLPTYVHSKVGDLATVGLILSMYGLWQGLVRFPVGIVADWAGRRKPFIIAGVALAGVGAWMLGAADTAEGLTLARTITGIAAGSWVPLVVAFSAMFPPEEVVRANSLLAIINSVARIAATGSTGFLNEMGGYSLAFFLAAIVAGLGVMVMLPLQESRQAPKTPSARAIRHVVTRRDVLLPSVLSAVAQYANWALVYGFVPVLAKQMGATDMVQSALVTMTIAFYSVGSMIATYVADRVGAERMVFISFILLFLGTMSAAIAPGLPALFGGQMFMGIALGINNPVLMGLSIRRVGDAERGTAMGLHQAVYAIGMFLGPACSGALATVIGIRPMFGATAFFVLILGLAGARSLRGANRELPW